MLLRLGMNGVMYKQDNETQKSTYRISPIPKLGKSVKILKKKIIVVGLDPSLSDSPVESERVILLT
jgi:hypothetical protein